MSSISEIEKIQSLVFNLLKLEDQTIMVQGVSVSPSVLLQDDMLMPILVGLTNALAIDLFEKENLFKVSLTKEKRSLGYVKLDVEDEDETEGEGEHAPLSWKILFMLEIASEILRPQSNNIIDLTDLVFHWREELSSYDNGELLDPQKVRDSFINKRSIKLNNDIVMKNK